MEKLLRKETNFTLIAVLYCFIYIIAISLTIGINHSFWTDEHHFLKTIHLFINQPTLDTLLHYEEMSTPLPFILYACWGKIAGSEISTLRIFSLLVAFSTLLSIYFLFKKIFTNNPLLSIIAMSLFSIIPYIPGLSIFLYTDMQSILFMSLALIAMTNRKPLMFFTFSFAALMCRQYLIFFTAAGLLFFTLEYLKNKNKQSMRMAIAALMACFSLAPLFYFWKGLSPDNEVKNLYTNTGIQFHFDALIAYLCCVVIYCAPVLIFLRRTLFENKKIIIAAFVISFVYWIFPIKPSLPAVEMEFFHIGFFHKSISYVLHSEWQIGIVFQTLLFISLLFISQITKLSYQNRNTEEKGYILFAYITIICFMAVMPFSYLTWEKYIIPLTPYIYIISFEMDEFKKNINQLTSKYFILYKLSE